MATRSPSLAVVAPCPIGWEQLAGNDRVRFCGHCQQNVHNVASLTMDEAAALIQRVEGRACLRLQRRADGTVITRDCFHAVRRARERIVASALGVMVAAAGYWTGVQGLRKLFAWRWSRLSQPECELPPAPRAEPPSLDDIPDWLATSQGQGAQPRRRPLAPRPKPKLQPKPQPPVVRHKEVLDYEMGLGDLKY